MAVGQFLDALLPPSGCSSTLRPVTASQTWDNIFYTAMVATIQLP